MAEFIREDCEPEAIIMNETVWVIHRKKSPGVTKDFYLKLIGNFGTNHFDTDIFSAMKWEEKPNLAELPKSIAEDKTLECLQVILSAEIVRRSI